MIEAYPLTWPVGYGRTSKPKRSRFVTTLAKARDYIKAEISRISGSGLVISTNLPTNQKGELRADCQHFKVDDMGAAIYFTRNKQQVCLCCDTYDRVHDNLYAIGRALEGLRQIDRDGVSDFLNRTFSAFPALPQQASVPTCWEVLGIAPSSSREVITSAYRQKAKTEHPDTGGTNARMQVLTDAYNIALSSI